MGAKNIIITQKISSVRIPIPLQPDGVNLKGCMYNIRCKDIRVWQFENENNNLL